MQSLTILVALFGLVPDLRDGTVVVLENSNSVVELYTKSEITHVAILLNDQERPWVYEATPHEVRKLSLDSYYEELAKFNRGRREKSQLRVRLYQPRTAYSSAETAELRSYLESQLGRRYSVKGYVRKKPNPGVHCAELVSSGLTHTGRYHFEQSYAISPSALVTQIATSYDVPRAVTLPCHEPEGTWCERSKAWWGECFAWWGWACWETLTFYP